jgi:hypothetical protein
MDVGNAGVGWSNHQPPSMVVTTGYGKDLISLKLLDPVLQRDTVRT